MSGEGSRGKVPEAKVRKWLSDLGDRSHNIDWHRVYDARSAGGRFPKQTGDFQLYGVGWHAIIEVKEVNHDFRLPHKNYSEDKVAKCWKRELAGSHVLVLVFHSTTSLWRLIPFYVFRAREGGSWNLTNYPTFTSCKEILDAYDFE